MSLADQLQMIKNSINEAERELTSLTSGRKVSASRLRKHLQTVKAESQILRKSVIKHIKDMPTKSRVKAVPEPEEIPKLELVEPAPQVDVPKPKKRVLKKKQPV
jgi:hypothetical protein